MYIKKLILRETDPKQKEQWKNETEKVRDYGATINKANTYKSRARLTDKEWLRMTFNDLEWPKMTKIDLKWLKIKTQIT